jgi:hypothetical protein
VHAADSSIESAAPASRGAGLIAVACASAGEAQAIQTGVPIGAQAYTQGASGAGILIQPWDAG